MNNRPSPTGVDPTQAVFQNLVEIIAHLPEAYREQLTQELDRLAASLAEQTARVRELGEREERFRALADGTPVIMFVTNAGGAIEFINRAYADFFGVTFEQVRSQGWQPLVHPDDTNNYTKFYTECMLARQPFRAEARVRKHTGEWRWIESHAQPRFSDEGEFLGMAGSALDITERKQAEAAIAEDLRDTRLLHELSLRLVSEGSNHVLYQEILTAAITLSRADAGTVQILDPENQELVLLAAQGFSTAMTTHFNRVDARSHTSCGRALAAGARSFLDFDVPASEDPDGSLHMHFEAGYCSVQSTPLTNRTGRTIGMLSTHWRAPGRRPTEREMRLLDLLARQAADLIERTQSAEALAASERRFRDQIKFAPTAIYEVDFRSGRFTAVNDAMIALSGYSREELLNMTAFELLDDEGKRLFRERIRRWLAGEKPEESVEYRVKAKDGRTIYAVLEVTFIKDASGRPLGATVIGHDITERKRMEMALEESERKYRELVQHAATAIYEVDFQTQKFTVVNDSMVQITGYSHEELLQMHPIDLLHEDDQLHFLERFRGWGAGEHPPESVEFRIRTKSGGIIYAELHTTFTWDENGRPRSAMTIGHDISERKKAELVLQAAAARDAYRVKLTDALRTLDEPLDVIATAARALGEYLPADHVVYAENKGNEIIIEREYNPTGRPSSIGRHSSDELDETIRSLREGAWLVVDEVHESTHTLSQVTAFRQAKIGALVAVPLIKNGEWVATVAVYSEQPRRWQPEEVNLIRETAERTWDAVERARANKLRGESDQRFRRSIENLNEAFAILSAVREDGRIVDFCYDYVNDACCQIVQLTPQEIIGRRLLEILAEHRVNGLFDRYVEVIQTGKPFSDQVRFSGEYHAGQIQIEGIFNIRASKFGDGLIITANDVTEQVKLEEQNQAAIRQREIHHRLGEQREMERQSIARDLHDGPIQTLSSLAFNLQYLKETYNDPALRLELDEVGLGLKGAIQELRQVMNDLRPPTVLRFGLTKAIQVHVENLRERAGHIVWKLSLSNDRQMLSEQASLSLFRIYQEATNNILRHSQASKAWVTFRMLKNHAVLEVRDNGRGIAGQQDIATLTNNHHFGLAGITERVEALRGEMHISSGPGMGTTLRVKIPFKSRE